MSNANSVFLGYMVESTFGDIPATAFNEFRNTGESLGQETENTTSQELRADRQIADVIRTSISASGDVNTELSYAAFDDMFEAALSGTWGTPLAISVITIAAATAPGTRFTSTTSSLTPIAIGQTIRVAGFANSDLNDDWLVTDSAGDGSWIEVYDHGGVFAVEAEGATVTVAGTPLVNGTVERSFVLEKSFTDITEFISLVGMTVGTFSMNVTNNSIVTQTFGFMGKSAAAAGATVGTGASVAAATNPVMNGIDNVTDIIEGGVLSAHCVSEITFSVENNLRNILCVGSLGPTDIGYGSFLVTGTLNVYFASRAIYEKYLNWTASALQFTLTDSLGNSYVISFPAIKYTGGEVVAGGLDQDVLANLSWTAYEHATQGITMRIDKLPAP